jgi:hypothetical protein
MVEVQDKLSGRRSGRSSSLISSSDHQRRSTGSVPVVLPHLVAAMAPPGPALSGSLGVMVDELSSLVLIVVIPTAFWCGTVNAVRSLLGLDTSAAALSCLALAIAGFLLIIRASLTIDRSV